MQFPLIIKANNKRYLLTCRLWQRDKVKEQYKIHPQVSPDKYIILQNNRPLIRGKGLKHRRLDWKLVEGSAPNRSTLDKMIKAIENHIEPPEPEKPEFGLDLDFEPMRQINNRKKGGNSQTLGEKNNI